jgi:hypothetical protein
MRKKKEVPREGDLYWRFVDDVLTGNCICFFFFFLPLMYLSPASRFCRQLGVFVFFLIFLAIPMRCDECLRRKDFLLPVNPVYTLALLLCFISRLHSTMQHLGYMYLSAVGQYQIVPRGGRYHHSTSSRYKKKTCRSIVRYIAQVCPCHRLSGYNTGISFDQVRNGG